ncbi:MAG TPA: phage tail protein [Acetobacteraceae bacterium]|jgi:phage tail-like protein|nr:phage tail protein [Acetobacteraceae bacterium]
MAVSATDIKATYPLPVYNFRVEIGADAVAFSEVSGLSIQREVTTFKESPVAGGTAGPRTMHMPAQASPVNVTLKKGVARSTSVATLYSWIGSITLNQVEKKDILVRLCDEAGKPVISWKIINAFPTKLDGPSFDAKSSDVAVESMELRADAITITES